MKKQLKHRNLGEYLEENHIDDDRLNALFKEFKDSDVYNIICAHLEDYKDLVLANMRDLNVQAEGYDRVMTAYVTRMSTIEWFKEFVDKLKGFDESERSDRPKLSKYK